MLSVLPTWVVLAESVNNLTNIVSDPSVRISFLRVVPNALEPVPSVTILLSKVPSLKSDAVIFVPLNCQYKVVFDATLVVVTVIARNCPSLTGSKFEESEYVGVVESVEVSLIVITAEVATILLKLASVANIIANFSSPSVVVSVSYTHLTLPTKA